VAGTEELAADVAALAKIKPVHAFIDDLGASAAYWVASQAQAVYATASARVGSIGVILPFIDSTEAFKQAGLKVEVFAAGKFKSAGTPGVPLTDAQRALLQSDMLEYECSDSLRCVQIQLWQLAVDFGIAGDGYDIAVMRMNHRLSDLGTINLELGNRFVLETLNQQEITR
jgi:hypothetical protein